MEGQHNGTTNDEWTAALIGGETMYFHPEGGCTRQRPEAL